MGEKGYRTHCAHGHEMTPENTGSQGRCKACANASLRNARAREKAKDPEAWRRKQKELRERWKEKDPERYSLLEKARNTRARNKDPEKYKAAQKLYYEQYVANNYEKHLERHRGYAKKYHSRDNPKYRERRDRQNRNRMINLTNCRMAELMGLPVAVVPSEILEIRRLLVKLRRAVTRKTHCIRGHERTPENINKQNTCKQCLKILQKNYRERKKAEDPEGWKKNQSAANLRYRTKHPETVKAFHKRYYRLHPEKFNNKKYSDLTERELERRRIYNSSDKILGWHRENSKRKAIALTDSYVVSTIRPKVPLKLATPDLIEVKRQTIRLNRILKSQRRFVNQRREQHVC